MEREREGGNEKKRPDAAEDLSDGVPEGSPDRAEASISRRGRGVSHRVLPSLSSAALPFEPAASPVPAEDPLPSFLKSLYSGPSFPFLPSSSLSMRPFPSPVSTDVQGEDLRRASPPSLIRPRCTDDDLFEPTSIFTSVRLRHTKHTFGRARTRSDRERNDMATVTRMSARQGTSRGNQTARLAKRCVPKDSTHKTGGRKEGGRDELTEDTPRTRTRRCMDEWTSAGRTNVLRPSCAPPTASHKPSKRQERPPPCPWELVLCSHRYVYPIHEKNERNERCRRTCTNASIQC